VEEDEREVIPTDRDLIRRPQTVSADWAQAMLARNGHVADVLDVTVEPVGTGQLGDTVRMTLTYGARQGPGTIIGKFAATSEASRQIASNWRLYEREVGFYRYLAEKARVATAGCYASVLDEGSFVLLLEDCAPARPGDQIAGIAVPAAHAAIREAARLHSAFWDCGDNPDLAWLETGPLAQPFYDASIIRSAWPQFSDRYADMLTDDMKRVCDAFVERYEAYSRPLSSPRCITHNDFRPDNMLFWPDGQIRIVDWQSAALGHNAVDISYLIGGAFSPDDRRDVEQALLDTYHEELAEQGVDCSRAELAEDYRHFTFAGINVAVGAAMMVGRTERGDRMFLTMLGRHVAHVLDTGALSILDERF